MVPGGDVSPPSPGTNTLTAAAAIPMYAGRSSAHIQSSVSKIDDMAKHKHKHKVVSRVEPNINGEADYIISKAQIHASRIVRLGPLVFFSTHTGDAWILDPEDNLALCLARGGDRQAFSILETQTDFQIAWEAEYHIDGEAFTLYTNDGRAKTILGYPTREIESAIEAGG